MSTPTGDVPEPPRREFDTYAPGYDAGMEVGLKRWLGGSADAYIAVKVRWLLKNLQKHPLRSGAGLAPRLLDFGCGAGAFLRGLRSARFTGALAGCDVSAGMLDEARAALAAHPDVQLAHIEGTRIDHPDAAFDVVMASAVFHHIPVAERPMWIAEMVRVLKPGGRLLMFEHNPFNPVTVWVVRHTEIDKNAILLRSAEAMDLFANAGLLAIATEYLMFLPPRLSMFIDIESWLKWLPFGAQYVVSGDSSR